MTITLDLTAEQQDLLITRAKAAGIEPADYVRTLIMSDTSQSQTEFVKAKTPAQVLSELKALGLPPGYGDPAIDGPDLARQLSARFSRTVHDHDEVVR